MFINISSMPDTDDFDDEKGCLNAVNNSIIAHADSIMPTCTNLFTNFSGKGIGGKAFNGADNSCYSTFGERTKFFRGSFLPLNTITVH